MYKYDIYKLKSLIKSSNHTSEDRNINWITKTKLNFLLKSFKCKRNKDVQDFLNNNAIGFEKRMLSNTYLLIDNKHKDVIAYFTLTSKPIDISNYDLSKKEVKAISGFTNPRNKSVSSLHIAQIAKNDNHLKFDGRKIWQAIYEIMDIWEAPFRVVSLDCSKELKSYYEAFNFYELGYVSLIKSYLMIKKRDYSELN